VANKDKAVTYKVSAEVAEYLSPDPMAAAAAIWTAHPQSIEAIANPCGLDYKQGDLMELYSQAIEPIVFASESTSERTQLLPPVGQLTTNDPGQ
jgi:hypothetical protein